MDLQTTEQLQLFDYGQLDSETRIIVQQRTGEIKDLVRSTAESISRIGEKLVDVRARLANGRFEAWLEAEFQWSRRTAYNFINVHEKFGNYANFAQLDIATSALYLLASPSTPDTVREELLAQAASGEKVSYTETKTAISEAKAKRQPSLPAPPPPPPAPYAPQHSTAATFEAEAPASPVMAPAPPPPAPVPPPPPIPAPTIGAPVMQLTLTVRQDLAAPVLMVAQGGPAPKTESVPDAHVIGARVQAWIDEFLALESEQLAEWLD